MVTVSGKYITIRLRDMNQKAVVFLPVGDGQVLRVISNACTDKCLYTLDIYRGGPDNFAKWFQKNVPWQS